MYLVDQALENPLIVTIPFEDYSRFVRGMLKDLEILTPEILTPEEVQTRLQELLAYGAENYQELDEQGKSRADLLLQGS